ncbi:MAG: hypothetical protein ACD_58C00226G0001 [uncultured bacterium]|nr:MAG: hypothetical protein ACD_58C00226G0001 [uncultured bacterium]
MDNFELFSLKKIIDRTIEQHGLSDDNWQLIFEKIFADFIIEEIGIPPTKYGTLPSRYIQQKWREIRDIK